MKTRNHEEFSWENLFEIVQMEDKYSNVRIILNAYGNGMH
jgi:hypothetical protein